MRLRGDEDRVSTLAPVIEDSDEGVEAAAVEPGAEAAPELEAPEPEADAAELEDEAPE
jgi:hypothetical protein